MPRFVYPAAILAKRMNDERVTTHRLAADIGVPSGRITEMLHRKRGISPDTAARLGHWFGDGDGGWSWLEAQARHDLRVAIKALARDLADSPTHRTSIKRGRAR